MPAKTTTKRVHKPVPDDPGRCACGEYIRDSCAGGFIGRENPDGSWTGRSEIRAQGATGGTFREIAGRLSLSVHTIRRVLHG